MTIDDNIRDENLLEKAPNQPSKQFRTKNNVYINDNAQGYV